jgi:riboflavin biosynthesis pyrimidine reductase
LAARGITRLLVEGGARLAASLLRRRLVDRLAWFQAPVVIGGDGLAAIAELGIDSLAAAVRFARQSGEALAPDTLEAYIVCAEGVPCSPGSSPTSAGSSKSRRSTARTKAGG